MVSENFLYLDVLYSLLTQQNAVPSEFCCLLVEGSGQVWRIKMNS